MIIVYEDKYEKEWDNLVLNESSNGNFLQSRCFLNYHAKNKFKDHSLLFYKGESLAAVMPACEMNDSKELISHPGSTFGGLIIRDIYCSSSNYKWIFNEMTEHFKEMNYTKVELKMPNWLYRAKDKNNELLDYFFQLYHFSAINEVGFFIDMKNINEDYENNFDSLKKRKLKKAYKNDLCFKEVENEAGIKEFYSVLSDNMKKFDTKPVHSLEELLDLKYNRFNKTIHFYGVYHNDEMIAGSMVFDFCNRKVFHTQYLASRHDRLDLCPNEFLYTSLINQAKKDNYRFLSYGTTTLEHGLVYNESLALYKEGFNTDSYINPTYIWKKAFIQD